jgi:hypothetical protein
MSDHDDIPLAYLPSKPRDVPTAEQLRERVPGWGADLDPADRPSHPKLQFAPGASGARWEFPERQPGSEGRERSIEHAFVTPVFGTAQPLHGVSGAIRRFAYDRYSEGRLAHWLLLVAGDRVDSTGAHLRSFVRGRPDDLLSETGVTAEAKKEARAASRDSTRVDRHHRWLDPLIVAGPWVVTGVVAVRVVAKAVRALR